MLNYKNVLLCLLGLYLITPCLSMDLPDESILERKVISHTWSFPENTDYELAEPETRFPFVEIYPGNSESVEMFYLTQSSRDHHLQSFEAINPSAQTFLRKMKDVCEKVSMPGPRVLGKTFIFCMPYMLAKTTIGLNLLWNAYLYGQIDETAVAADGLIMTWQSLVMGAWLGGLQATSILVGQLPEESEFATLRGNVHKVAFISSIGYSLATIPLFIFAGPICEGIAVVLRLQHSSEITNQVQSYFNGYIWGVLPTLQLYNDEQLSLGILDVKVPFIYDLVQVSVASALAYPLTLGKLGFPELGTQGIGLSMAIGAWAAWLCLRVHYTVACGNYKPLKLYSFQTLSIKAFKKYFEYSFPLSLANSVGLMTAFSYSSLITGLGTKVASAFNASAAYLRGINISFSGYTSAISALIANKDPRTSEVVAHSGEELDVRSIKQYYNASVITSVSLAALLVFPVIIEPEWFINFFGRSLSEEASTLAKSYIGFSIANILLSIFSLSHESSLHGLKDLCVPLLFNTSTNTVWLAFAGVSIAAGADPVFVIAASVVGPSINSICYIVRWKQMFRSLSNELHERASSFFNMDCFLGRCWGAISNFFSSSWTIEEAFS